MLFKIINKAEQKIFLKKIEKNSISNISFFE